MHLKFITKIVNFAEIVHLRFFGHLMSPVMRNFLRNLSWSFFGIFFGSLILFVVNILAGRMLGPAGYGKYNYIISLANILGVILLFGSNTAIVKFVVQGENELEKNRHISNSFWLFLFMCAIASAGLIFSGSIESYLSIERGMFMVLLVFSFVSSFKNLLDSYIRSLNFFSFQAKIKLIENFIVLLFFLCFFFLLNKINYVYYLVAILIGISVACTLFFWKVKARIIGMDIAKLRETMPYLRTNFLLTISSVFVTSIDKIYIGKFVGAVELGIYSAYILASTIFVGQIILVLGNVFFPLIVSIDNKKPVIEKIDKISIFSLVPATLIISIFSIIIIKLLGKGFEFSYWYVLLFSLLAFFQIISSFYLNVASSDTETYKKLKHLSYYLFFFLLAFYVFVYVKNLNSMHSIIIIYATYVIFNMLIIRMSCVKKL